MANLYKLNSNMVIIGDFLIIAAVYGDSQGFILQLPIASLAVNLVSSFGCKR